MVREISEPAVSRPDRSLFPFAVIGALVLALPLSACGRKGPLDPPPGGYMLETRPDRTTAVTPQGRGAAQAGAGRTTTRMAARSLRLVRRKNFPPIG